MERCARPALLRCRHPTLSPHLRPSTASSSSSSPLSSSQGQCRFFHDHFHAPNPYVVRQTMKERGQTGVPRPGAGFGVAAKLNPLKAKNSYTRSNVNTNKTVESVDAPYESFGEMSERDEILALRERYAQRARVDAIDTAFAKKGAKTLSSFTRAFGNPHGTRSLTGDALARSPKTPEAPGSVDQENVAVSGLPTPPVAVSSFKELRQLGAPSDLALALQGEGWIRPTPVQGTLWVAAQLNRDAVCVALPGSGKTVAYAVPAILRCMEAAQRRRLQGGDAEDKGVLDRHGVRVVAPTAVVVVPSVALATQVLEVVRRLANACGVVAGVAAGGSGELYLGTELLVTTPQDLLDVTSHAAGEKAELRKKKKGKRGVARSARDHVVSLSRAEVVVLDEADHLMSNEADAVETALMRARGTAGASELQLIMVASTWSTLSAVAARRILREGRTVFVRVGSGQRGDGAVAEGSEGVGGLPSVRHRVHLVPDADKAAFVALLFSSRALPLDDAQRRHRYVVFASSPEMVDALGDVLQGVVPASQVVRAHEGMLVYQRDVALERLASGDARVLVCTDIFARGIHLETVNAVINVDLPPLDDAHALVRILYQRNGRTGRGNRYGIAHTLVSPEAPKVAVQAVMMTLHPDEQTSDMVDLLRPANEKSTFVKTLEMSARARTVSFDDDTTF
eukprot:Rhum_TRINITY_DN4037_c0_g1::Rhum_TRINITY_DN4037_c0_g1_i1::g.12662::m.12662/K12811/DDX46, PRP5; ATP-dependent RNA helicase DDX46/PRP5